MFTKFIKLVPGSIRLLPNDDLHIEYNHINVYIVRVHVLDGRTVCTNTCTCVNADQPFCHKNMMLECYQTWGGPKLPATPVLHDYSLMYMYNKVHVYVCVTTRDREERKRNEERKNIKLWV